MAKSDAVAADLLRVAFGRGGETLIAAMVAIAALTFINATMIVGARGSGSRARHPTPATSHLAPFARHFEKVSILRLLQKAFLAVSLSINEGESALSYKISSARKSFTLVCVGPVMTRSPSASKKP